MRQTNIRIRLTKFGRSANEQGNRCGIDLPKPEKIPSLGKIIEKHKSLTEYGESDLLSQIIIYAREHNMNQDEYLKLVDTEMANYRRQVAEQEAKKAAALAKRRETLAKRPN